MREQATVDILRYGGLSERMDLCKRARLLQRHNEDREGPLMMDRCELDLAVYCGFLWEDPSIRYRRWCALDDVIGQMTEPDMVFFFKLYDLEHPDDPRKGLLLDRARVYQKIEEDSRAIWTQHLGGKRIPLIEIDSFDSIDEKLDFILRNCEEHQKIVLTGASHGGKTSVITCLSSRLDGLSAQAI